LPPPVPSTQATQATDDSEDLGKVNKLPSSQQDVIEAVKRKLTCKSNLLFLFDLFFSSTVLETGQLVMPPEDIQQLGQAVEAAVGQKRPISDNPSNTTPLKRRTADQPPK